MGNFSCERNQHYVSYFLCGAPHQVIFVCIPILFFNIFQNIESECGNNNSLYIYCAMNFQTFIHAVRADNVPAIWVIVDDEARFWI